MDYVHCARCIHSFQGQLPNIYQFVLSPDPWPYLGKAAAELCMKVGVGGELGASRRGAEKALRWNESSGGSDFAYQSAFFVLERVGILLVWIGITLAKMCFIAN